MCAVSGTLGLHVSWGIDEALLEALRMPICKCSFVDDMLRLTS
jgi:hypothetical protein